MQILTTNALNLYICHFAKSKNYFLTTSIILHLNTNDIKTFEAPPDARIILNIQSRAKQYLYNALLSHAGNIIFTLIVLYIDEN
jgi:hypothetical protein